jgi:hypothetical protein
LLDNLPHSVRLRVIRMNFNQFGHARIVGEQGARA